MQQKIFPFLLFLFLGLSNTSLAGEPVSGPVTGKENVLTCTYLAPTSFQPMGIGVDFIQVTWIQPGSPPPGYNLKTYLVSNGSLVANVFFPNNTTSYTQSGLSSGTAYNFVLTPACGTELSPYHATIGPITTLILDLVVLGFNPCRYEDVHLTAANNYTDFPADGSVTTFKASYESDPSKTRIFGLAKINGEIKCLLLEADDPNDSYAYKFLCDGNSSAACDVSSTINVRHNQTEVVVFHTFFPTANSPGRITINSINSNYEIIKMTCNGGGGRPGNAISRNGDQAGDTSPDMKITASPNPFNNALEIQIPYATTENDVKISLYDLQGRLIITEKSGGAQMRTLNTTGILPGLYLLRVDTGDRSETIKVVKTQ